MCLIWSQIIMAICMMRTVCSLVNNWLYPWEILLVGGVESIDFGSTRWCVWIFRPCSPFAVAAPSIFVCLFFRLVLGVSRAFCCTPLTKLAPLPTESAPWQPSDVVFFPWAAAIITRFRPRLTVVYCIAFVTSSGYGWPGAYLNPPLSTMRRP